MESPVAERKKRTDATPASDSAGKAQTEGSDPDHFPDARELARNHSSQTKPDVTNPYTLGDPANPLGMQEPANDEWTGEGNTVPYGTTPQVNTNEANPYSDGDPANPLGTQAPLGHDNGGTDMQGHRLPQTDVNARNPYATGDPANPLGGQRALFDDEDPRTQEPIDPASTRFRFVTIPIALVGALFGVLAAIYEQTFGGHSLALFVAGPVIEECVKPMGVIWLLEYRPRWLSASWQVVALAALSGLVFATIENLVYIHIYVPDGTPFFQAFRWIVCTALHVGCCTVFGLGLARNWRLILARGGGFQIDSAFAWFVAAAVIHGAYNFSVTVLQVSGVLTFD